MKLKLLLPILSMIISCQAHSQSEWKFSIGLGYQVSYELFAKPPEITSSYWWGEGSTTRNTHVQVMEGISQTSSLVASVKFKRLYIPIQLGYSSQKLNANIYHEQIAQSIAPSNFGDYPITWWSTFNIDYSARLNLIQTSLGFGCNILNPENKLAITPIFCVNPRFLLISDEPIITVIGMSWSTADPLPETLNTNPLPEMGIENTNFLDIVRPSVALLSELMISEHFKINFIAGYQFRSTNFKLWSASKNYNHPRQNVISNSILGQFQIHYEF